jgi:hypothetical protein
VISDLRESDLCVICRSCRLAFAIVLSSFPFLFSSDLYSSKRHQVVVVLVRGLIDPLIKEKSSLGLGDRLREGKRVERDPVFVTTSTGSRFARTEPR